MMMRFLKSVIASANKQVISAYSYLRFAGKAPLRHQIKRHIEHWNLDNAISISHTLVPRLAEAGLPRNARVLVVGCCNMLEIHTFLSYGYRHVQGIDLISHNPRYIKVMDMHDMSFPAGSFDAIYCSGVLQCSHDPARVAREFYRVLKRDGLIAISVPVKFDKTSAYIFDVNDADALHALFDTKAVIWSEVLPGNAPGNPNASPVIYSIFRSEKV